MSVLKAAVVGLGRSGSSYHLPAYARNPLVDLVAVSDTDRSRREQVADTHGVEGYDTIERLFSEEDIDLASICTPPKFHYDHAKLALEHEINTLVEKPFTLSVEDAKKLKELDNESNASVSVVHNRKYKDRFLNAFEHIKSGTIGRVTDIHYFKSIKKSDRTMGADHWANDLPGGGWGERIPHPLYIIYSIAGPLKLAVAEGISDDSRNNIPNDVYVLLKGDCFATIRYSTSMKEDMSNYYVVHGTKGRIKITSRGVDKVLMSNSKKSIASHNVKQACEVSKKALKQLVNENRRNEPSVPSPSHYRYIKEYVDFILGKRNRPTSWEETLYAVERSIEISESIDSRPE